MDFFCLLLQIKCFGSENLGDWLGGLGFWQKFNAINQPYFSVTHPKQLASTF
jgi:hypothetical protein